jgi:hypothetical protein
VHRIGELAVSMQHVLIPGLSSSRPRRKPSERENMMPAARTSLVLGKKQRNMPCRRIDSLPYYSAFLLLRTRLGKHSALCSHILLTNSYEHPGSRKAHASILQESSCMASILRSNRPTARQKLAAIFCPLEAAATLLLLLCRDALWTTLSVRLRSCVLSGVSNRLALVAQIYRWLANCGSGVWDRPGCRFAKNC